MFLSEEYRPYYAKYEKALKKAGVHILRNGHEAMVLKGERFCFWGLELPIEYYHKPRSPKLKKEVMENLKIKGCRSCWHIIQNTEKPILNGARI